MRLQNSSVLLVSENRDTLIALKELLAEVGPDAFDLELSDDYKNVFKILRQRRHDVYVIEHRVGVWSGIELMHKALPAERREPVIIFNGPNGHEAEFEAIKLGAAYYLSQGDFSVPLLEKAIRYAVDQKRARSALVDRELHYRRLIELSPDAIVVFRGDRILFANAAAENLLKTEDRRRLTNRPISKLIHFDDRERFEDKVRWLFKDEDQTIHLTLKLKCFNETSIDAKIDIAVVDYDGESAAHAILRNVTTEEHTANLEHAPASLKEVIHATDQAIGTLGHELRTPLASIRAMSEYLINKKLSLAEMDKCFLTAIHDEVIRMSEMVNNMLEAARLGSGAAQWNWGTVDLKEVCRKTLTVMQPLMDQTKVKLSCQVRPIDLKMKGDAEAIRRLILNLITNAKKHTQEGSIEVFIQERQIKDDSQIEIRVSDTGEGICPEVAEKLGVAFALNSGVIWTDHVKGAGLGLAICKGIAAAHGGVMSVDSKRQRGTTFTVCMKADLDKPIRNAQERALQYKVSA